MFKLLNPQKREEGRERGESQGSFFFFLIFFYFIFTSRMMALQISWTSTLRRSVVLYRAECFHIKSIECVSGGNTSISWGNSWQSRSCWKWLLALERKITLLLASNRASITFSVKTTNGALNFLKTQKKTNKQ